MNNSGSFHHLPQHTHPPKHTNTHTRNLTDAEGHSRNKVPPRSLHLKRAHGAAVSERSTASSSTISPDTQTWVSIKNFKVPLKGKNFFFPIDYGTTCITNNQDSACL